MATAVFSYFLVQYPSDGQGKALGFGKGYENGAPDLRIR